MTLEQVSDSMAPRGGTLNGADKLFPAVEAAYRRTVDALRAIRHSRGSFISRRCFCTTSPSMLTHCHLP